MNDKVNEFLNIPERIVIGYRTRPDTFTGKLSYVTYYKGKEIAKKTSWNSWRMEDIPPSEFDNVPTEGFDINKAVGGGGGGWNARKEYCRVYDPRGFEFEISFENLVYILQNTGYIPGKGLLGKFVYAWDRADLVLLPVVSEDYEATIKLKEDVGKAGIKVKDLVIGKAYKTKKFPVAWYIGKQNWKIAEHEKFKISEYHTYLVNDRGTNKLVGINTISNILLPLDKERVLGPSEVAEVTKKFKESLAGNTADASEIRLENVSDQTKKEWEKVLNGQYTAGKRMLAGKLSSDGRKLEIHKIWMDDEYDKIWGGKKTGKVVIKCTNDYNYRINSDGWYYRESCTYPFWSPYGKSESIKDLIPIEDGSGGRVSYSIKIGDLWYPGTIWIAGAWKPEIELK